MCQLQLAGCLLGKAGVQDRGYRGFVWVGNTHRLRRCATTAGLRRSAGMNEFFLDFGKRVM